jgi:uncharacterized RDD family membrane protein YckC
MASNSAQDLSGATSTVMYAGFWARVAAYFVDYAVVMVLSLAIGITAFLIGDIAPMLGSIVIFLVNLLYWPVMESSARQATFGKSLVGIKVTDMNGRRTTFLRAFLRNLAKIISALPLGIGFLLAAFTGRKQALHDMLTKSLVVRSGPSHLFKAVAAAVGGLAITVACSGAYFYYVYLPQMQGDISNIMQDAMQNNANNAQALSALPQVTSQQPPKPLAPVAIKPMPAMPDFDTLTGTPLGGFEAGGTTRAGPAILQLSTFFGNTAWLKVHLPAINNLDLTPGPAVTISSVLDASGKNYYDDASMFEKGSFTAAALSPDKTPVAHLSGTRSVHLKPGLTEQALQKIEGQVRIAIPVDVKSLAFDATETGKEKTMHGAVVALKSLSAAKAVLHLQGARYNTFGVRGYDKAGAPVEITSRELLPDSEAINYNPSFTFKAPVNKIEVLVSAGIAERQFPFVLTRTGKAEAAPSAAISSAKPDVALPSPAPEKTIIVAQAEPAQPAAAVAGTAESAPAEKGSPAHVAIVKHNSKRQKRRVSGDLRHCLDLQGYEAIAKCAGE